MRYTCKRCGLRFTIVTTNKKRKRPIHINFDRISCPECNSYSMLIKECQKVLSSKDASCSECKYYAHCWDGEGLEEERYESKEKVEPTAIRVKNAKVNSTLTDADVLSKKTTKKLIKKLERSGITFSAQLDGKHVLFLVKLKSVVICLTYDEIVSILDGSWSTVQSKIFRHNVEGYISPNALIAIIRHVISRTPKVKDGFNLKG